MNTTQIDNVTFIHFPSALPRNEERSPLVARPRPRRPRLVQDLVPSDTLVERMTMGDGVALDALKDRYGKKLTKAAKAIVSCGIEAERIVALVFEEASAGWPPERGHVERWLLRLVRRAARERRRAREGLDT